MKDTTQCVQEGDFVLPESAAILRYLATSHDQARHWYPTDAQRRARIDAALDWQHSTVRAGEARLVSSHPAASQHNTAAC
jgi:glutathione S-transferase